MFPNQTDQLGAWIKRLQEGDSQAKDFLLRLAEDRLRRLARKMLKSFPAVHRWEQTDDVFQNASIRLHKSLDKITPQSVRHFFNLAAMQIRRELIDLSRHYFGPDGLGANHATTPKETSDDSSRPVLHDPAESSTSDPSRLERWCEFHKQVDLLPEAEREIFNLLWYEELSQDQAGIILGISSRTLQRRWQSARLKLFEAMQGSLPE